MFFAAELAACGALLDLQPLDFEAATASDGGDERGAVTETGSPLDGGGEASADGATHCSDGKRHDFCDDFEGITGSIEDRWQKRKELNGTGQIGSEVTDGAPSPVTVFRTSMQHGEDGGTIGHIARLSRQDVPWPRTTSGTQPGIRIAFEIFFEQLDVAPYNCTFFDVKVGQPAGGEDYLSVYAYREGSEAVLTFLEQYVVDGGFTYAGGSIPTRIPIGTWTPIELVIQERAEGFGSGAVLTVGTTSTPYTFASTATTPGFRADLGLNAGSGGTQSVVLYDNVRMDYLP